MKYGRLARLVAFPPVGLVLLVFLTELFCCRMSRVFVLAYCGFCACYCSPLCSCQWLHENRIEGCTEKALDGAASAGHLEIVQWLHENRTEVQSTVYDIRCTMILSHLILMSYDTTVAPASPLTL